MMGHLLVLDNVVCPCL